MKKIDWRKLDNYPGYSISSDGQVRSDSRILWNGKGFFRSKEKLLKPNTLAKGYYQVELKVGKMRHPRQVHRLVAETFIPNPNDYPQVNHINGIKNDNRVENLEWCNNSMNQLHAYKIGLNVHSPKSGKPKRAIKLIDKKTREELSFESIAQAVSFLGKSCGANLMKVLKNYPHYNTIKGYYAKYI